MAHVIRECADQDLEQILEVINDAAQAYKGVIPEDRFKEPYMPRQDLSREIEDGVRFWGLEQERTACWCHGICRISRTSRSSATPMSEPLTGGAASAAGC